jgi:hypothetical protein
MSNVNFYKILGVARSASADEIKAAYRELVKRYHPDLFSSPGAKAKATETLRQINEAYAVIGNAERRRRYDLESAPKPQARPSGTGPTPPRRTPRPVGRQVKVRRKPVGLPRLNLKFSKKWAGYSVAAATVILILVYASRSEPRLALAWTLWEKIEVSALKGALRPEEVRRGWTRVSDHSSAAECSAVLRKIVDADERAGSKAVFDEKSGNMAITVYVEKESGQAPPDSTGESRGETSGENDGVAEPGNEHPAAAPDAPADGRDLVRKRVRNLECRATQRLESDSLLQRALRRVGLIS